MVIVDSRWCDRSALMVPQYVVLPLDQAHLELHEVGPDPRLDPHWDHQQEAQGQSPLVHRGDEMGQPWIDVQKWLVECRSKCTTKRFRRSRECWMR